MDTSLKLHSKWGTWAVAADLAATIPDQHGAYDFVANSIQSGGAAMTQSSIVRQSLLPVKSYLVLVQPMLEAIDISGAITEFLPRANVIIAQTSAAAGKALTSLPSIHLAFLGLAPGSETGLRLAVQVRSRGGRPVFIGDYAEDLGSGPDWTVLVRPFSTECVQALLNCTGKGSPSFHLA